MRRYLPRPMLKHLVYRYKKDVELLEKHPEYKEMLERRIERHKQDIVDYVTSESFAPALATFNL